MATASSYNTIIILNSRILISKVLANKALENKARLITL